MRILILTCLLVGLFAVSLRAEDNPVKAEASADHAGVRLHAKVTAPCIAGSTIQVTMSLSNNSNRSVSYGLINCYYDFDIQVTDAEGRAVPLTRFGNSRIGGNGGQFGSAFKYNMKELKPGASYRIELNLGRLFDVSVAGTYSLRIRRRVNEGMKDEFILEVKDIKIVVGEDEPKVVSAAPKTEDADARE